MLKMTKWDEMLLACKMHIKFAFTARKLSIHDRQVLCPSHFQNGWKSTPELTVSKAIKILGLCWLKTGQRFTVRLATLLNRASFALNNEIWFSLTSFTLHRFPYRYLNLCWMTFPWLFIKCLTLFFNHELPSSQKHKFDASVCNLWLIMHAKNRELKAILTIILEQ